MRRRHAILLTVLLGLAIGTPAWAGARFGRVTTPGMHSPGFFFSPSGTQIIVVRPSVVGSVPVVVMPRARSTVAIASPPIRPIIFVNPFVSAAPFGRLEPGTEVAVSRFAVPQNTAAALLILDARPLEAKIFFDGQFVGHAAHFAAQAFAIPAGKHALKIVAPGFQPFVADFDAVATLPTSLSVQLTPQ